ncbi:MAG: type II secretion system F family protein [Hyphomicrobiales bacterium]|nr:type II secretion system F family protein [Hyphomicrobiales bacterium]MBV9054848.1 type II secretion system F family protein [Hyphomicrobiales bacterium]MBV9139204.1 type II secretion system F family protein [Hyphomicrobiales bacterium]MBV9590099.1 type II secretion system F family protein [Hyphomicrobiales bacterium]MBV9752875.1 type II secretion system F family protein [Hyphomicrobiales bacterium]
MALSPLLIGLLAAISLGGIAFVIMPYLSGEVRVERRHDQFINRNTREVSAPQRSAGNRREQVAQTLKDLEERQAAKNKVDLPTRIAQAGLRWTRRQYYITSGVFALVLALVALLVTGNLFVVVGAMLVGALGLPRWLLIYLTKRRSKKFVDEFANAVDVVVRGVRSGLPLGDCIRIVATEAAEPVKSEFRHIIESQSLGLSIAEACERLYQRVPVTEANFFGIVIAIQQKAGGNLGETLANFSRVIRERRKMAGKIQAMSMEAKASAGIIACLPFGVALLVYLSSPDYISLLWQTFHGKVSLMAAGLWMGVGVLVMRKMIHFDF